MLGLTVSGHGELLSWLVGPYSWMREHVVEQSSSHHVGQEAEQEEERMRALETRDALQRRMPSDGLLPGPT